MQKQEKMSSGCERCCYFFDHTRSVFTDLRKTWSQVETIERISCLSKLIFISLVDAFYTLFRALSTIRCPVVPDQSRSSSGNVPQPLVTNGPGEPNERVSSSPEVAKSSLDKPAGPDLRTCAEIRLQNYRWLDGRAGLSHFSWLRHLYGERVTFLLTLVNDPASFIWTPRIRRGCGVLIGMACGDSVGAPYEFRAYQKTRYVGKTTNRFSLLPGQWTDDSSMGLCLADMLLSHAQLDDTQLMWAFCDWWERGYNNAFTDPEDPRDSVGLGGNISESIDEFSKSNRVATGPYATRAGDIYTSGNGSLMRLGPVAVIAKTEEEACDLARRQSRVTHQGTEAADCCALMAGILFRALHSQETDPERIKEELLQFLEDYTCSNSTDTVVALAHSSPTPPPHPQTLQSENWNWRAQDFTYNETRVKQNPGYVGSYAMDALAMALHCVFSDKSTSFQAAVEEAAFRCGDADTVAAITGQIAGAIYGVDAIPAEWRANVQKWDRGGEIVLRGVLLSWKRDETPIPEPGVVP